MSSPLTHSRVLKIAVPIVLANITVPFLGAVDTAVVGQMGLAAPIGAVGIGAIILSALYWIFGFLRMGTVGLTSQAHGGGDRGEVSALLQRALLIGGAAGVAMILLQAPLFMLAFWVSPASQAVETMARDYMQIRIFSAPAIIAMYGITGWLIALERTRSVLVIQLLMNGMNILLDFVFVLGFEWGVAGVAWATFLAEWSGLALGLYLCRDALLAHVRAPIMQVFERAKLIRMAVVNGDILVRTALLEAAFVSFLFLGSGLGDTTLAANQVLLQFLHITAFGMDGFAFAAETLVGQAVGAKAAIRVRRAVWMTSIWGAVISIAFAMVFAALGPWLITLMAKDTGVQNTANIYLFWMVLAPLAGCAAWMLDGIFIGATRTQDMRNMMIISALGYGVMVAVFLPIWGNHGLWASMILFFILRGITLGARYPSLLKSI